MRIRNKTMDGYHQDIALTIPPYIKNGDRIKADGKEFVIKVLPSERYERKGDDLYITITKEDTSISHPNGINIDTDRKLISDLQNSPNHTLQNKKLKGFNEKGKCYIKLVDKITSKEDLNIVTLFNKLQNKFISWKTSCESPEYTDFYAKQELENIFDLFKEIEGKNTRISTAFTEFFRIKLYNMAHFDPENPNVIYITNEESEKGSIRRMVLPTSNGALEELYVKIPENTKDGDKIKSNGREFTVKLISLNFDPENPNIIYITNEESKKGLITKVVLPTSNGSLKEFNLKIPENTIW